MEMINHLTRQRGVGLEQCLGFSCVSNSGHKFAVVSGNLNKMRGDRMVRKMRHRHCWQVADAVEARS